MIPINQPLLPTFEMLTPYLKLIDQNRYYTNFGPLNHLFTKKLEKWFFDKTLNNFCVVTCSSATLGLELAIQSLNLLSGSKILIPAFTFIGTAAVVLRCGHIPVVADVDIDSWLLTTKIACDALLKADFDAVIPVSTFGKPLDQKAWAKWSKDNKIPVIIDSAGGFGSQMPEEGILVVYSLHATKALPGGEGGIILTSDPILASQLKKMTNFGIGLDANSGLYNKSTNAKLSEYHCAVGLASLDRWEETSAHRKNLFDNYVSLLKVESKGGLVFQPSEDVLAPTILNVLCHSEQRRGSLESQFRKNGIETRRWYQPLIHQHPNLPKLEAASGIENAQIIALRSMGLPFYLTLQESEVKKICMQFRSL